MRARDCKPYPVAENSMTPTTFTDPSAVVANNTRSQTRQLGWRRAVTLIGGCACAATLLLADLPQALAQSPMGGGMGGGGMGGGMGGMPSAPQGPADDGKDSGIAEAAPKAAGMLPSTPVLPMVKSRRKRWKLLEIDGYFRMRSDWFKNFNLGFVDDPAQGGAPFPQPLACARTPKIAACGDTMSGTNMRLRLEPTLNIDEGTAVHTQIDVLDNLVLGSTPYGERLDGTYTATNPPPNGVFGDTQGAATRGVNSDRDAIAVKRVWAEVALPLGILKFGRMPNHWGMGILANGGGQDPIHGTYDYDGDYGDNVDRVSFSTQIPGTQLRAMLASDWTITRLTSNQTNQNLGRDEHPFDLDDSDDANQWVLTIAKLDAPTEWRDTIARGALAYNWGGYFAYRTQSFENDLTDFKLGGAFDGARYVARDSTLYIPSLWGRVGYGPHTFEAEAAGKFGTVGASDAQGNARALDVRMWGAVARYSAALVDNRLKLGVEGGIASGDDGDNTIAGRTHLAYRNQLGAAADGTLSQFTFNRDYKIDMILFRHLLGAVSNAGYAKPFVSFDLTSAITGRVANITAFAPRSNATPGNSRFYGSEFDAEVTYRNGGFMAGISYGVLFPFAAMAHPVSLTGTEGGFGDNVGEATTAHSFVTRLTLMF